MNIIYGNGLDKVESHDYAHGFDPHDDWHTYEMEWTPHYISWHVDGHEMRHVDLRDPAVDMLHKAQSLRMNFWTPTFHSWGAGLSPIDMPWYVLYDYVEVFTYDEEQNAFKFHWRDDFDSFDSGKWHKAAGGFESNTSVFHPANAYTSGGHMVLKMEPEHTHFEDLMIQHELRESFNMDVSGRRELPGMMHGYKSKAEPVYNDAWTDSSDDEHYHGHHTYARTDHYD